MTDTERELSKAQAEVRELKRIIDELTSNDVNPSCHWAWMKIRNQTRTLDSLQRKGKGHTKEEREQLAAAS